MDAGNGDGGFGDVGGEDDAAVASRIEYLLLVAQAQAAEQRQDVGVGELFAGQGVGGVADFAFAGQENEDVAVAVEVGNPADRAPDVGGEFLILAGRHELIVDRVHASLHGHDRGMVEKFGEMFRVEGGGTDDDPEVGAFFQQVFQITENEIDIQASFMGLVDDQRVVLAEEAVVTGFRQQDAVGHEFDGGLFRGFVVKTDLASDFGAE